MKKAILATKVGMTQIFNEDGVLTPVTVLQAGPCVVTQVKTEENDGYKAVQVGFVDKREKLVTKPVKGHFDKAGVAYKRYVREFRLENAEEYSVKDEIKADIFAAGDKIDATAISKGKGFQHIIAICNHTIIDLPDPPRLKNPAQSAHRSSRKPEPARQITACPHRNIAQRHHVAGNDSVHDLIHCPVTAHDHNHPCLLAVGRQLPCILCRLPRIFCQICLILNPVPHKPLLYFLPYLIAAATL